MLIRHKGVTFRQVKTVNLKNRFERMRYQRQFLIVKSQLEIKLVRQVRLYFQQQGAALAKAIKDDAEPASITANALALIGNGEQQAKGEKFLSSHYRMSYEVADKFITSGMQKSFGRRLHTKQDRNFFEEALISFIRQFTADHIKGINETTKTQVARVIERGLVDGNTTIQIEKDILKAYSGFTLKRAGVIARTETTQAVGTASRDSFSSFGFQKPMKTWLHTDQDDPRPEHKRMDETTIPLDAKYKVDNPKGRIDLMWGPGDNEAPPEQTINCSCVEAFDAEDELDELL